MQAVRLPTLRTNPRKRTKRSKKKKPQESRPNKKGARLQTGSLASARALATVQVNRAKVPAPAVVTTIGSWVAADRATALLTRAALPLVRPSDSLRYR